MWGIIDVLTSLPFVSATKNSGRLCCYGGEVAGEIGLSAYLDVHMVTLRSITSASRESRDIYHSIARHWSFNMSTQRSRPARAIIVPCVTHHDPYCRSLIAADADAHRGCAGDCRARCARCGTLGLLRATHLACAGIPLPPRLRRGTVAGAGERAAQRNIPATSVQRPWRAPYLVVNYPPVYLIAAWLLAPLIDSTVPTSNATLLAGRLITLLATLGSAFLLWRAALPVDDDHTTSTQRITVFIATLAFLALPIVREWGALMRVDMLGVCLGLWGLSLTRRLSRWAALPLALSCW